MRGQNPWTVAFARFDIKEFSAREARYGLRGGRIGEASHPGPPKFSRCRSRSRDISLAEIYLPDSDSESDDEPLVSWRPGLRRSGSRDESRNVAPRVDRGHPGETVLWIPRRLRVAPQSLEDDLRTNKHSAQVEGRSCRECAANVEEVAADFRRERDTPADTLIDAVEFVLTREDSSSDEMCPDAEVGATVVDPVAMILMFRHRTNHQFRLESLVMQFRSHFRSASSSSVGTVLCQFRVVGVRGCGVPVCQARMFDETSWHQAILRASRGWKLFLLLPRLLLHRSPRGGKIPKAQLQRRMEAFSRGDWAPVNERVQPEASPATSSL